MNSNVRFVGLLVMKDYAGLIEDAALQYFSPRDVTRIIPINDEMCEIRIHGETSPYYIAWSASAVKLLLEGSDETRMKVAAKINNALTILGEGRHELG